MCHVIGYGIPLRDHAREIWKIWPENGPKIIAITAFDMEDDRKICLESGMDDCLPKPVMVDDLIEVLRKVLPFKNKI